VASVSAPVRDRGRRVVAAVSISGPIERLGRRPGDRHAVAVVRAGHRLSGL
jgi:DNA-binding IclR family transcriptional regulator